MPLLFKVILLFQLFKTLYAETTPEWRSKFTSCDTTVHLAVPRNWKFCSKKSL